MPGKWQRAAPIQGMKQRIELTPFSLHSISDVLPSLDLGRDFMVGEHDVVRLCCLKGVASAFRLTT